MSTWCTRQWRPSAPSRCASVAACCMLCAACCGSPAAPTAACCGSPSAPCSCTCQQLAAAGSSAVHPQCVPADLGVPTPVPTLACLTRPHFATDAGLQPGGSSGQRVGKVGGRQQLQRGGDAGDAPSAGGARHPAGCEPGGRSVGAWVGSPGCCKDCMPAAAVGSTYGLYWEWHAGDVKGKKTTAGTPSPARDLLGCPLCAQVEFSLCHALPARNGLLDACNELGVRWAGLLVCAVRELRRYAASIRGMCLKVLLLPYWWLLHPASLPSSAA